MVTINRRGTDVKVSRALAHHFLGFDIVSFDIKIKNDSLYVSVYSTGVYERRMSLRRASSMVNIPQDVKKEVYSAVCGVVHKTVKGSLFHSVELGSSVEIEFTLR